MRFIAPAIALTLSCFTVGRLRADEPAPVPAPAAERQAQILSWIADLGSDDFRTREQASQQLAEAGAAALEALEAAARSSDSLEVRWRAQQLLMRLNGHGERPMGTRPAPGPAPGGGLVGPQAERLRELLEMGDPAKVRELIERMFDDLHKGERIPRFDFGGLRRLGENATPLVAGNLTLRPPLLGLGAWTLEVRGQDASGKPTLVIYQGESLEAILEANPALREQTALGDLTSKLETRTKAAPRPEALRGPTFTFKTSQGVEVHQDADGALVKIEERGPDGKVELKEYRGATLDEIRAKHPELAERLGGLGGGFRIHVAPPRFFGGPREEPLPPLPEETPDEQPAQPRFVAPKGSFGVRLAALEPALAGHLKLRPGQGVLVADVAADSQAARLGLEVYDVILGINGVEVLGLEDVAQRLRAAAGQEQAPLALDVLRGGDRRTFSR